MSITHQPANLTLAQIQQMIGGVMLLSQHSPLHRRYVVAEWLQRILPAFELNQFCYYEDEHGRPIAFCNWAFVSEQIRKLGRGQELIELSLTSQAKKKWADAPYTL
ncbi:toxin-activating lysine-acyltransferase, partial [Vibrio cholerae]